jgi:hypothetical protein
LGAPGCRVPEPVPGGFLGRVGGLVFEGELSELFPVALGLVSDWQAGRISVRTEDEAAVAEGRGAGHHDGQRQRLAG